MKTVYLKKGDRLRVLKDRPFDSGLLKNQVVTVVGFDKGNFCRETIPACPIVEDNTNTQWYTELKELFHYFKKEKS